MFAPNKMPEITICSGFKEGGSPLVEFGKLEEGKLYAKVGRTTGLTVGTYRGVMACSWKREKDRIRYDDGGNEVKTRGVATHMIVGIKGIRFCELGDSGSFIISCDGKICGVCRMTTVPNCRRLTTSHSSQKDTRYLCIA